MAKTTPALLSSGTQTKHTAERYEYGTNIAQNYHLLSFNRAYSYTMLNIASVKIVKMLQSDKNLSQNSYIKPYDTKQYYLDNNAVKLVFPDIIGDTIRFSSDFQKLQVREFCLQRVKK